MGNLQLQICLLTWFSHLTNGASVSSDLTLWPDLSCHEDCLKEGHSGDENGEQNLIRIRQNCANEMEANIWGHLSAECIKRCVLENLHILVYRKFQFKTEEMVAESLNQNLFPDSPLTGEEIASRILEGDCQKLLTALENAESKPTCEDQEEFFNCVEKAMQCQ